MRLLKVTLAIFFAAGICSNAHAIDATCDALAPSAALTVTAAVQRVMACNRDVLAAQRAVVGSRADLRVAGQTPNPTLSVGAGSISPSSGVGAGPLWRKTLDSSLRLEQLLERGGKLDLRKRAAQHLVSAARQDVAEVMRQQGLNALQALVDLATADDRVAVLEDIARLYNESRLANERRTARGDLAPIDAQRQAIESIRAEGDLKQAAADAMKARLALAGLLALEPVAATLKVDPSVFELAESASLPQDVEARADVAAARSRVDAAHVSRDLARAQATADVTVGLQLDHWPTSAANPVGTGNTFSVTLSVPLMWRHRFDGELAHAISDSDAAEETLARVLASAQAERSRLDNDLAAALAHQQLLNLRLAPQAEQVARAAELGHAKGALNLLEVLDARRVLRQTRLDLLAARADVARAEFARRRWTASLDTPL